MDAYWDFARSESSGAPSHDSASSVVAVPAVLMSSQAAFADPGLLRDPEHRTRLLAYLDDETVDPSVLRRLAQAPARASEVFRVALEQPELDCGRDGEAREHKADYFAREPRPAITPVSERIAAALRGGVRSG